MQINAIQMQYDTGPEFLNKISIVSNVMKGVTDTFKTELNAVLTQYEEGAKDSRVWMLSDLTKTERDYLQMEFNHTQTSNSGLANALTVMTQDRDIFRTQLISIQKQYDKDVNESHKIWIDLEVVKDSL